MRNYPPDYQPIREYQKELTSNRAKGSLVRAARSTKAERIPTPQLAFRADNDTILRQQITGAQRPLARLDYRLKEMETVLSQGENDRAKLTTPRWRASYDLAMGRVLAMRVRAFGYNTVLAEMKSSPKSFQKKGSNMWRLAPSREIAGGPAIRKLAKKATGYLSRVIDEHSGTPWAMLAQRELGQPMGWQWQEQTMVIAQNRPGGANDAMTNVKSGFAVL